MVTIHQGVSSSIDSSTVELASVGRYRPGHRRIGAIWLACLALIVYGSLVPFDYRPLPLEEALNRFLSTPYLRLGVGSRADWIANIVLYVPLGYLAAAWAETSGGRAGWMLARLFLLALFSFSVAVSIEFAQLFFPPRTVSLNDLAAEGLGLVAGVVLWRLAGAQLTGLWRSVTAGGASAMAAGLALYTLLYIVISLFPYDFLVSASELSWKIDQGRFNWLLVSTACGEALRCTARLAVETLAIVPVGLLLGRMFRRGGGTHYRFAVFIGLLMGVALEGMQFFMASGVSQGASVVTRTMGVVAGLWLSRSVDLRLTPRLRLYGQLLVAILWIPYLALLTLLNGWYAGHWSSGEEALVKLSALRFIPFYYHYYVPEPVAVKSVLLQAALYLPVGLACWLWSWGSRQPEKSRAGTAALLAALLAIVVESSKLFLDAQRPDPTNIIIAAVSATLVFVVASWMARWSTKTAASGGHESVGSANVAESTPFIITAAGTPNSRIVDTAGAVDPLSLLGSVRLVGAFCLAVAVFYLLSRYPIHSEWLAAGFAVYAFFLWQRPWLWLVVVPATLPML